MVTTQFELMAMQLAFANRLIRLAKFKKFEDFVSLDRYKQDLESEVLILEQKETESFFYGK